MILGPEQQLRLGEELAREPEIGRVEVLLVSSGRGRGWVLITRERHDGKRWRVHEEVKIGARGAVKRLSAEDLQARR
jgi:hypothetical protein